MGTESENLGPRGEHALPLEAWVRGTHYEQHVVKCYYNRCPIIFLIAGHVPCIATRSTWHTQNRIGGPGPASLLTIRMPSPPPLQHRLLKPNNAPAASQLPTPLRAQPDPYLARTTWTDSDSNANLNEGVTA
jgi:hypothetical protein